jgi:hypothetical protein
MHSRQGQCGYADGGSDAAYCTSGEAAAVDCWMKRRGKIFEAGRDTEGVAERLYWRSIERYVSKVSESPTSSLHHTLSLQRVVFELPGDMCLL